MSVATKHRYESCRDEDCERLACRAWREAWAEGYREGFTEGFQAGYSAAKAEGG